MIQFSSTYIDKEKYFLKIKNETNKQTKKK